MSMRSVQSQHGVTLVEMMVALAIGLIISAGAVAIVLNNREANRSTEALARIQESTRVAFELMSRDLRGASINACSGGVRVMNLLGNPTAQWWTNWEGGLKGYEGSQATTAQATGTDEMQRKADSDALEIMTSGTTALPVRAHNPGSTETTVHGVSVPAYSLALERANNQAHSFAVGDLLVVCDYEDTTLFQASSVDAATNSVAHAAPAGGAPGNCSNTLGFRLACSTTANKTFPPGSLVMRFEPVTWYVGYNGSASNDRSPFSLYRISVRGNGTGNMVAQPVIEEIVEGVSDLQIRYITYAGEYVLATQTGLDWRQVSGVEIVLTIESPENRTSTSSTVPRVTRTLTHVVNLRNRV